MTINEEFMKILVCPECKGEVLLNAAGDGIVCEACRLVYPVKDDIPVMLADEAAALPKK